MYINMNKYDQILKTVKKKLLYNSVKILNLSYLISHLWKFVGEIFDF